MSDESKKKINEQKTSFVQIHLNERSYAIEIGAGIIFQLGAIFNASFHDSSQANHVANHVVILTDQNVVSLYAERIAELMAECGKTVDLLVVEPGEESKSIACAEWLWEKLLELGTDRHSVVMAVGGGVVGDLAGFVAATYARGIRFFQVPTTLLAQVDSSVGGKVGINLAGGKNMVGAFHQPAGVLIDTQTLDTLDDTQYLAGLGEVVKYGISLDAELFELLENNIGRIRRRDHTLLTEIIARCCRIKANIVEQDERETTGLRAKLNYGHTFAHAYETLAGYGTLLHGTAVAIGLVDAARLAHRMERVDGNFVERQSTLNSRLGLPIRFEGTDPDRIIELMMHDKKTVRGTLRFVLPIAIGQCELVSGVSVELVREILKP
ncbi:MAG: 3-dehydroquinate synthase [Planctomycetaceae bacterium]|nr:3-dehydroquinate synthase [Planctomycetaceae bacterium]